MMAAQGGEVRFLQGCGLRSAGETAHAPTDGPTALHIQAALSQLSEFENRPHETGRGKEWSRRGRSEGKETRGGGV